MKLMTTLLPSRARSGTPAETHDSPRSSVRTPCSRCFAQSARTLLLALMCTTALVMAVRVGHAMWRVAPRRPGDCAVPWATAAAAGGASSAGETAPGPAGHKLRIALVSMSTGRAKQAASSGTSAGTAGGGASASASSVAGGTAAINFRAAEFSDLLDLTGPVFAEYAAIHGYTYADASGLMDASRPASWSKILAVLSALDAYDWVMWADADILITNTSVPLERLLPAAAGADKPDGPDFILTTDAAGVNAGVWLMRGRGCAWCRAFLARWWSLSGFIRTDAASGKSGDNDALKHMIATMDPDELAAHVGFAPQCACNSYLWRSSPRTWGRWLARPYTMQGGLWQPGDFLLHLAGINAKKAHLRRFFDQQMQQLRQLRPSDEQALALLLQQNEESENEEQRELAEWEEQQAAAARARGAQPLRLESSQRAAAAAAGSARGGVLGGGDTRLQQQQQQLWNARRLQEGRRYLRASRGRRWAWGWGSEAH